MSACANREAWASGVLDEGARIAEAAELFVQIVAPPRRSGRRLAAIGGRQHQLPADDPSAAPHREVAAGVRRSIKIGP
jgi:hypothetical protein